MQILKYAFFVGIALTVGNIWAESNAINNYKRLTILEGVWILSPADRQEGGTTKKGPAAEMVGTDKMAMTFKIVGKGSAVQENLLPNTGKEMVTMYHCNDFKNCTQVQAKHYCAKQNQPELVLDLENSSSNIILLTCDMDTPLCNSMESHIHLIKHELSEDNNHLKTTYSSYNNGEFEKDSIYHFDRVKE